MADFGTYIRIGLIGAGTVLLRDILTSITEPALAVACGSNAPTAVDGATNCGYIQAGVEWIIPLVLASLFVLALSRSVVNGRPA